MIRIRGLVKKCPPAFTLKIDELDIADGERVALIGPNGSGKSTLLRLLSGIIAPDSGSIEITGGTPGYSPQSPYVFKGTVRKNIMLACSDPQRAEKTAEQCLLGAKLNEKTSRLSGGEKQRVCFARMLAGDFSALFLDEPLSAADTETALGLEKLLVSHCAEKGVTLVMSTHLPSQAFHVSTKILLLSGGEVAEFTDTGRFIQPESEFGKLFSSQWRI